MSVTIVTSPRCLEYASPRHPERPARVAKTVNHLKKIEGFEWVEGKPAERADIARVHPEAHIDLVMKGNFSEPDTPAHDNICDYALLSAGGAIQAGELAMQGKQAFSLMRPPGHHATRSQLMGFCYFNNVAVALESLRAKKKATRVAIFDFDCHHGNGTEDIYAKDPNAMFVSVHQSPCYPGTGLQSHGNCRNYPVNPQSPPETFIEACREGLAEIRKFKPDVLAVSAGFDAHKDDPITQMSLEVATYRQIGEEIGKLKLPVFAVLEGGYGTELPLCVEAFLAGWGEAAATSKAGKS